MNQNIKLNNHCVAHIRFVVSLVQSVYIECGLTKLFYKSSNNLKNGEFYCNQKWQSFLSVWLYKKFLFNEKTLKCFKADSYSWLWLCNRAYMNNDFINCRMLQITESDYQELINQWSNIAFIYLVYANLVWHFNYICS